jgi:hypothetical protein
MNILLLAMLVFMVLCGFQCSENNEIDKIDVVKVKYELDTNRIAIFDSIQISNLPFKHIAKGSNENLDDADLFMIEKILKECIEDYNNSEKLAKDINLDEYDMQLIPYLNQDGDKVVYVNCYCDPQGRANPNDGFVTVFDGGNCFFRLRINLDKQSYYKFSTNGHA